MVLFSDITEVARLQRQRREASIVFALLMIFVCLHLFLWRLLLLGVLGILYNKQGNIWGLSIIHYVLGQVATFLRFI